MWRGCLRAKSRGHHLFERRLPMFPISDPTLLLELHHQHVDDLIQDAARRRLVRSVSRRRRRWRRPAPRAARVAATT
jgi:hypothetical protein